MPVLRAREALRRIFFQRCFYLFIILLAFISVLPFVEPTPAGRVATAALTVLVVVGTVAAVGRSTVSFVLALLIAGPALYFHWLGVNSDDTATLALSWIFAGALYAVTIAYLLQYVFRPEVMTSDKLFGAAAAYLMIGVLWAYLYALVEFHYPGSFSSGMIFISHGPIDFVYFSFTVLTSTGFGDAVPLSPQARSVCVLEQVVGALFLAILIARLAGVYPPTQRRGES